MGGRKVPLAFVEIKPTQIIYLLDELLFLLSKDCLK